MQIRPNEGRLPGGENLMSELTDVLYRKAYGC
jgi:hypothetical protein